MMINNLKEAETAMGSARIGLLSKSTTFLNTIIFGVKHSFSEDIPTAATNGLEVKYNPEFFLNLTPEERIGLIVHETWHIAFMHSIRREHRDPEIWNIAGDYVINLLVKQSGLNLPEGGFYDDKYRNMSTNQVYDIIFEEQPQLRMPPGRLDILEATGNPGDEEGTSVSAREVEAQVKDLLVKAKIRSEMSGEPAGSIPGELQRVINELTNPKLDWRSLLLRFFTDKQKADYSWQKPNRRYLPHHILPSQYSEAVGSIGIAIDTSGSLSSAALTEILSEIAFIHETMKPNKLTILDCDTEIHNIYHVESSDEISELTFTGGGGTKLHPAVDYFREDPPEVMLYFTDLYAAPVEEETSFPILWICCSSHEPSPIGETIYLE